MSILVRNSFSLAIQEHVKIPPASVSGPPDANIINLSLNASARYLKNHARFCVTIPNPDAEPCSLFRMVTIPLGSPYRHLAGRGAGAEYVDAWREAGCGAGGSHTTANTRAGHGIYIHKDVTGNHFGICQATLFFPWCRRVKLSRNRHASVPDTSPLVISIVSCPSSPMVKSWLTMY